FPASRMAAPQRRVIEQPALSDSAITRSPGGPIENLRAHVRPACVCSLVEIDGRVGFYVLLTVRALVGYRASSKIHVIAHDSRAPASRQELCKCACAGLGGS